MSQSWERPLMIFCKERTRNPDTKAFALAKARKLTVTKSVDLAGLRAREISFTVDKRGKRAYNIECKAKHADQNNMPS